VACGRLYREAFAYIIPATFLVAIVSYVPSIGRFAALSWYSLDSPLRLQRSLDPCRRANSKARALALALGIQAAGIFAPTLSDNAVTIVIAAVALGGRSLRSPSLRRPCARHVSHETNAAVSRLTVLYSVGQIIGPLVATQLALHSGSYRAALLWARSSLRSPP